MIQRNDSAVSPVVGVMLMLVVTIIIAAVVSAFSGGLAGTGSKAPQASISAKIMLPPSGNQTIFSHNGGDAFDLDDIKVMFQSEDTKTTLTTPDVGTNCIAFQKLGDTTTTMIKPGDSFVVIGSDGMDASWPQENTINYGSFSMTVNTKVAWSVIDKASGNTIATGTVVL